jgi:hypothetical protein
LDQRAETNEDIAKLLEGCPNFDEAMHTPDGWGETFFGFIEEDIYEGPMTTKRLLALAKQAWDQGDNSGRSSILLVAALYVPEKGVYFGTITKKGGEDKFKAECPSFKALWDNALEERDLKSRFGIQQLYHAEDAAMWYAFKKGAFGDGSKLPLAPGSIMATFGENGEANKAPPKPVPACSQKTKSNIVPNCSQVLSLMGIDIGEE